MNLKELKKLADACRKAGIKSFKSPEYEFTLTDDAPMSNYKRAKAVAEAPSVASDSRFESDSLSEDELLFWSTGNPTESLESQDNN